MALSLRQDRGQRRVQTLSLDDGVEHEEERLQREHAQLSALVGAIRALGDDHRFDERFLRQARGFARAEQPKGGLFRSECSPLPRSLLQTGQLER